MSTFLFSYRVPQKPLLEALAELDEAGRAARMAAWTAWFDSMGDSVLDRGNPVADARGLGKHDNETRIGGYSLVTAEDLDAALALASGCPALQSGGGIEVGVIMDLDGLSPSSAQ